jgi:hypothetical protein
MSKPVANVTGASSGIGLELAAICAEEGFNLLAAADCPEIHATANRFLKLGAQTSIVETDLATPEATPSGRRGGPSSGRAVSQCRSWSRARVSRSGLRRRAPRHRHQRHRHGLSRAAGRPSDARPRQRLHSAYRLDCRVHAGQELIRKLDAHAVALTAAA